MCFGGLLFMQDKVSLINLPHKTAEGARNFTHSHLYTECPRYNYTKINAFIFVPKRFTKFIFSALYRVTQKVFNAHQYTSMWAPVVA
jgi:hypothetical protein